MFADEELRYCEAHPRGQCSLAWAAALVASSVVCGQPPEDVAKVKDLVARLDAESRAERDKAEEALLATGPDVLQHLPPLDAKSLSAEQRTRLRRVLPKLHLLRLQADVKGRPLALPDGPVPLSDLLQTLQKQSGNVVRDLREEFGQEVTDPKVTVGKKGRTFWEVLDDAAAQGAVSPYFLTDDRSVGVVGRPAPSRPVAYAGALRLAIDRLVLQRDFAAGKPEPILYVGLEVLVEPRLRPVLFELDAEKFNVVDDREQRLVFANEEQFRVGVEDDSYQTPLTLPFKAPARNAQRIVRLAGTLGVLLPGSVEEFRFVLAKSERRRESRLTARVELGEYHDDGQGIWTFPVTIEQLLDNALVESFLQARVEPELYLESAGGERHRQNAGANVTAREPGRVATEYQFADVPGKLTDYTLVVRVPVGLQLVQIPFEFRDLALP